MLNLDGDALRAEWDGTEGEVIRCVMQGMINALHNAGAHGSIVIGHSLIADSEGAFTSTFGIGIPDIGFVTTSRQNLFECFSEALRRLSRNHLDLPEHIH